MRYGFTVGVVICEYAQVWFNGAMRKVVEILGIAAMPNANYFRAAKRIVGME